LLYKREDGIQFQKTQAHISFWGLLMASHTHRKALLKVLNPAQVPIETKPEQLCHMVGTVQFGNLITFTDLDLPKAGPNQLYAL